MKGQLRRIKRGAYQVDIRLADNAPREARIIVRALSWMEAEQKGRKWAQKNLGYPWTFFTCDSRHLQKLRRGIPVSLRTSGGIPFTARRILPGRERVEILWSGGKRILGQPLVAVAAFPDEAFAEARERLAWDRRENPFEP